MARQPGTREASAARWVLYHSLKAASRSGDMVALTTKIAGRLTRRSLSRRQVGPERLGAPRGDLAPQLERPVALPSELGAPGPETSRDEVERVLVREADGAVRLMRNARPEARRHVKVSRGSRARLTSSSTEAAPRAISAIIGRPSSSPATTTCSACRPQGTRGAEPSSRQPFPFLISVSRV